MAGKKTSTARRTTKSPATAGSALEVTTERVVDADFAEGIPQYCDDDVRIRAYLKWEAAGRPDGDGLYFWVDAERELREQETGPGKPHF